MDVVPEKVLEHLREFSSVCADLPKSLAPAQVAELRRRAAAGEQKTALARALGISRETVYQYLKV